MCVSDKRKTARPFFDSRLFIRLRAVRRNYRASPIKEKRFGVFRLPTYRVIPSSGRSGYIRVPLTTAFLLCKNAQLFCKSATRHPCRALHEAKFPAPLATSALARSSPRSNPLRLQQKKCFNAVFSHALFCRIRTSRSAYRPSSVLYISPSCLRVFRKTLRPCFLQRR